MKDLRGFWIFCVSYALIVIIKIKHTYIQSNNQPWKNLWMRVNKHSVDLLLKVLIEKTSLVMICTCHEFHIFPFLLLLQSHTYKLIQSPTFNNQLFKKSLKKIFYNIFERVLIGFGVLLLSQSVHMNNWFESFPKHRIIHRKIAPFVWCAITFNLCNDWTGELKLTKVRTTMRAKPNWFDKLNWFCQREREEQCWSYEYWLILRSWRDDDMICNFVWISMLPIHFWQQWKQFQKSSKIQGKKKIFQKEDKKISFKLLDTATVIKYDINLINRLQFQYFKVLLWDLSLGKSQIWNFCIF